MDGDGRALGGVAAWRHLASWQQPAEMAGRSHVAGEPWLIMWLVILFIQRYFAG